MPQVAHELPLNGLRLARQFRQIPGLKVCSKSVSQMGQEVGKRAASKPPKPDWNEDSKQAFILLCLAFDTVTRPRDGLKALGLNFFMAFHTDAIAPPFDAL